MKRAKPPSNTSPSAANALTGEQRLNKLLAAAGFGSRRQVDELIEQGRVEIDGVVCEQLGMKVNADTSKITVDGTLLKKFRPVYFALNKPAGVLCTNRDPQGRRRAIDFVPGHHRLFPVGRLDASSVGLLLLTNDGELTQQLTHPKHGVPKTYHVVVAGQLEADELRRLKRGIYLAEGVARVENVKIRKSRKASTELEITLTEGKNREIRRVLARIGHKVVTLRRVSIGPLKLSNMPEGAFRPLTKEEISALYHAAEDARKARKVKKKEEEARRKERQATAAEVSREARRTKADDENRTPIPRAAAIAPDKPRDPFAWDDDDELLKASPFAQSYRSPSADSEDEDEDEDEDEGSMILDEESDVEEPSGFADGEMVLIDDRVALRGGSVIDYEGDHPRKRASSRPSSAKHATVGTRPKGKGKSPQKRSREADGARDNTRSKPSKKSFSGGRPSKKKSFKKGGGFAKAKRPTGGTHPRGAGSARRKTTRKKRRG